MLKDKCKEELKEKANKAIRFIHELLASKNPYIIGQTRKEAIKNKMEFSLKCPDDEILQCCLQMHELEKSVVIRRFITSNESISVHSVFIFPSLCRFYYHTMLISVIRH